MCSLLVSVHICPLLCSEFFLAHFGFCLNCQRVITLSPSLKSVLCIDVIFRGCGVYSCYYIPGPPTWLYNFDECCLCCFAVISCSDCPLNACLEALVLQNVAQNGAKYVMRMFGAKQVLT